MSAWSPPLTFVRLLPEVLNGQRPASQGATAGTRDIQDQLDRLKWSLWHGNVYKALQKIEYLAMDLETMDESLEQWKLLKVVREFRGYIAANKPYIPNYGDRYRNGKPFQKPWLSRR